MLPFRPQFRSAFAGLFSSLLSPLYHLASLAPWRLRQCLLGVSFSSLLPTTFRGKIRFFTYKPDIFGHFLPLIWVKWAIMLYLFFAKHRHFVRQSLNTPPPLPGHFRTFPDIFSHFVNFPTSTRMAWHDKSSFFRQYRYLALQS